MTSYDRAMGELIHRLNLRDATRSFWLQPYNQMPLPLDFSWRDEVTSSFNAYAYRVSTYEEKLAFLRLG